MMSSTNTQMHQSRLRSIDQLAGRVLLFGGSFDPIHAGHIELAKKVAKLEDADMVLFMPAGQNPFKAHRPHVSDQDRLAMVELAIAGEPGFFVSDYEILAQGKSYTVDTISKIVEGAPKISKLIFAMGADQIAGLHKWKDPEKLFQLAHTKFVRRGSETLVSSNLSPEMQRHIADNIVDMHCPFSSTSIRIALKSGELGTVREALPEAVLGYIERRGLYR